jgi:hypothetical protein
MSQKQKFSYVLVFFEDEKYQNIFGWGGAFTDSAGINIATLDEAGQDLLIK